MFFEYDLTVTAGTLASAPVELEAPLSAGVVRLVAVQFPGGCRGEVAVSIWRSEHQVWPVNLDGSISADGATVQWPEDYDLADKPHSFTLKGWAPDTRFPHTITFRFALLSLEQVETERSTPSLLARLVRFVGMGP